MGSYFFQLYIHRKHIKVTDAELRLVTSMSDAPISYIVSKPPLNITAGKESYPLASGLSHQVNT